MGSEWPLGPSRVSGVELTIIIHKRLNGEQSTGGVCVKPPGLDRPSMSGAPRHDSPLKLRILTKLTGKV